MKRLIAVMSLFACACGGGSTTAPTPKVTAPIITTSNSSIYIGQTVQFSATGSGTIRWGGDASGVATVDVPTGRVTGVGNGRETIWAENEGGRTTRGLRGLPSYAGTWTGTYAVTGCQATGDISAIGFCGNFFSGEVLNIGLAMSQTDDRITSGAFALGANQGTLNQATVAENGSLAITGVFSDTSDSTTLSINLQNVRFDSPTAGTLTGSFDQSWSVSGASGFGIVSCSVRDITRTSGGPTLVARPSHGASLSEIIQRLHR